MKKGFSTWYNYLIGLAGLLIATCVALIPYFVTGGVGWPFNYIYLVYLFSAVALFGIGFIWQDIYRATIRHKTKNWDKPLDKKVLDFAWSIFTPFILGAFYNLVVGIVFSIISVTVGPIF